MTTDPKSAEWMLVPVEPTAEMLNSGAKFSLTLRDAYKDMLRAAPPAPSAASGLAEELVEACIIGLAIAGGLCENPDEWLRGHEKRLRELEKIGRSCRSHQAPVGDGE